MFACYTLEKAAPMKVVWFCHCKTCPRVLGPFSTVQKIEQRKIVESAGWTYGEQDDWCDSCTVAGRSGEVGNKDE